jgi:sulfide:quinone oxidoreductase
MTHELAPSAAEVVIVGGGIAALEALLALSDLAGERVRLTLVAPDPDLVDRPMTVAEPFGFGAPRRHPLAAIASHFDATLVRASVKEVRAAERRVVLRSGDTLAYDMLVLATGARTLPAFDHAITFGEPGSGAAMRELVDGVARGAVRRVAFIAPTAVGWTLPLYELALLTARAARRSQVEAELVLITREERPLAVFGTQPSATAAIWLRTSGVEFIGATRAETRQGVVMLEPGHRSVPTDAIVALPLVRGPRLEGVPADEFGFIPVDRHGRVTGLEAVYAAGDATDFPVKQGGLAAQQADAVVAHIAAHVGARVAPAPFRPVLRGMLFTGEDPHFLHTRDLAHAREGTSSPSPLWWPPTKIAGRYLGPYLFGGEANEAFGPPPGGFAEVGVELATAERTGQSQEAGEPMSASPHS